jgi:hypothetical protein
MNRFPFALRSFAVNAAIAMLLAGCGGGDGDAPPASASNDDNADAATLAQVAAVMASVNASTQALGMSAASDDKATPLTSSARPATGFFPGVSQTNLVANNSEFGAQIVEPDLKNPWGIAIRPAGFGGHFWFAAAGTGKSIQYVGDVGSAS